ncbi:cupin domain-containing protein [Mycobacterium sp. NPDC003449]
MTITERDMARTLHMASDDLPWVPVGPEAELRIIHARPDEDFVATQLRAQPGAEQGLHRHLAPVFGFTSRGAWGHDRTYEYRPGTYVYETPGVVHKFLNGPEVSEVFFINHGVIEFVDATGTEVIRSLTLAQMAEHYLAGCEEAGLPRPNVLF